MLLCIRILYAYVWERGRGTRAAKHVFVRNKSLIVFNFYIRLYQMYLNFDIENIT